MPIPSSVISLNPVNENRGARTANLVY